MRIHMRVLSESYPMNTNMTGFRWFKKNLCIVVLRTEVASTLEGLKIISENVHNPGDLDIALLSPAWGFIKLRIAMEK